jgi:hypothetical protein
MTISRIEGGKIVEEWQAYDNLSVMELRDVRLT